MWRKSEPKHKFALGQVVGAPAALEVLQKLGVSPATLLERHVTGDWGDLSAADKQSNDEAVAAGDLRILSSYELGPDKVKVWVITEADRAITTILLPSDY